MTKNNKKDLTKKEAVSADNIISEVVFVPIIKPMNPEALIILGWFFTDVEKLTNWLRQLFSSDVDLKDPKTAVIKNAADIALTEVEDDIIRLKVYLSSYVPDNK